MEQSEHHAHLVLLVGSSLDCVDDVAKSCIANEVRKAKVHSKSAQSYSRWRKGVTCFTSHATSGCVGGDWFVPCENPKCAGFCEPDGSTCHKADDDNAVSKRLAALRMV